MKKLFSSDRFFLAATIIGVVLIVYDAVVSMSSYSEAQFGGIIAILTSFCIFVIYVSYQKHNKNLMKGMLGAVLMAILIGEIYSLMSYTTGIPRTFAVIRTVLAAFLFINHFTINADRDPSPEMVRSNQVVLGIYALVVLAWGIVFAVNATSSLEVSSSIAYILGFISELSVIVCIESRLDAYRLDRTSAGWTAEKGYPEGYTRKSEKK